VAGATVYALRRLAQRIQALTDEAHDLELHITAVITAHAPQLLQRHGIGPDSAAALLITAGDNPDRMTSEASFAALCGVSPPKHPPARPADVASTAAVTDAPTPLSTASP
jgi:transposase